MVMIPYSPTKRSRINTDGILLKTAAKNGFKQMIVPLENAQEAAVVSDLEVYGAGTLTQAASMISGRKIRKFPIFF